MSTRSAIGYYTSKDKSSFKAVYCHWDGYPSGVGRNIWEHAQVMDLNEWSKKFIDDTPQGISSLGSDPHKEMFPRSKWDKKDKLPREESCKYTSCYDPNEGPSLFNEDSNLTDCGCEYLYLVDKDFKTLDILCSYNEDGSKMIGMFGYGNPNATWSILGTVDLTSKEPDKILLRN